MERSAFQDLQRWKSSKHRKPLILQGARQVGKTYLLREFGKQEFKNVAYCNFERDKALAEVFHNSLDPQRILDLIGAYLQISISPRETLIVFDEIQECGPALTSLKYFYEQASNYHLVAAGSLLGVTLADQSSFPVGSVDFLSLWPLSFFEYVEARGKKNILDFIRKDSSLIPIPQILAEELLQLLSHYYVVGGMPEAVQRFLDTSSLEEVRIVQENILKSYVNDFAKHAPRSEVAEILSVWEILPTILARENRKFSYAAMRKGARAAEFEKAINWLVQAGVVTQIKNISSPHKPIRANVVESAFKIYLNDVGLLSTQMQLPTKTLLSPDRLLGEYVGAISECFVAQELTALGYKPLYYWTSTGTAEIDFVLDYNGDGIPLEVKSGTNVKSKSLTSYIDKYTPNVALRTSLLNVAKSGTIINCPLYCLERIKGMIESFYYSHA